MKTIAFFGQKGGGGKSTNTVHTAVQAELDGERVVVLDADPQGSACTWAEQRPAATPVTIPVHTSTLTSAL